MTGAVAGRTDVTDVDAQLGKGRGDSERVEAAALNMNWTFKLHVMNLRRGSRSRVVDRVWASLVSLGG
jgi:hypothetical protein